LVVNHGEIPGLIHHADRRPDPVATGIGNQDIEPAESLVDLLDGSLHRRTIGRVGGNDGRADFIGDGPKRLGTSPDERDIAAFLPDAAGNRRADARAAAGDYGCFVLETHAASS
jgi:hypothetical protein